MQLIRYYRSETATLGRILVDAARTIHTLERPWMPFVALGDLPIDELPPCGRKGVSCVPPGRYKLVRHSTEAHPNTYALVNPALWVYHQDDDVPFAQRGRARTAVLIHPANYVNELRGCIAPGMTRSGETVQSSRAACVLLLRALEVVGDGLEIVEDFTRRV